MPKIRRKAIVVPERESPGRIDKPWTRPIVNPLKYAKGLRLSSLALSSDITKVTEAPSDNWDEFPAVTDPFSGSKTGFKDDKPSRVVSGLLHSSLSTV